LKKLSLTWSWKAPAATMLPFLDHTGVFHFHSSTTSGAASRISLRSCASTWPRQSARPSMCFVICRLMTPASRPSVAAAYAG
jgi:hypothetical protein